MYIDLQNYFVGSSLIFNTKRNFITEIWSNTWCTKVDVTAEHIFSSLMILSKLAVCVLTKIKEKNTVVEVCQKSDVITQLCVGVEGTQLCVSEGTQLCVEGTHL